MGDLAGLDIGYATRKRKAAEAGVPLRPSVADKLAEAGRLGQKTGAGWYRYEAGNRDPIPDPATEALIAEFRSAQGITPRAISDEEVGGALHLRPRQRRRAHSGGRHRRTCLRSGRGLSQRLRLPRLRGGPMLYADMVGLPNVVRSLRRFAAEPGADPAWQPAPLLVRLAEAGKTFD
jgi:3-hydroxyacyl-CoA dehydrogenase